MQEKIHKKQGQTRFLYDFVRQRFAECRWTAISSGANVFSREVAAMLELKTDTRANAEYEEDLALWYARQAELLRGRRFDQLDLENLIEELETAVGNLRRELSNRLEVLIIHLLKCEFQRQRMSRSWLNTLDAQRSQIAKLLDENPSLRPTTMEVASKVYPTAARRASTQTGLPRSIFPLANPYSKDQLFDFDFVP
jgi:hypothetical protein